MPFSKANRNTTIIRNFNVIILIGPIQNGVRGVFPGGRGFGKSLKIQASLGFAKVFFRQHFKITISPKIFTAKVLFYTVFPVLEIQLESD